MRKALIPAFVLVVAAIVLGSTLFREQIVSASTTPFQNVVVQNMSTNPIPVQQIGTSTTSVSGTVGIDPSTNTVKLDPSGNTVGLDSTDSAALATANGHLSAIDAAAGKFSFDGSGNLKTTAQVASPDTATGYCVNEGITEERDIQNDSKRHTICSSDFYVTDITGAGMDDALKIFFYLNGTLVYELDGGSGSGGADSYQVDLTHPLHIDFIEATCSDGLHDCLFMLSLLGNSTGT